MVCTERVSKIDGGFVLVPVASLMAAWKACRSRPLGVGDFRAWLACREMVARRCTAGEGRAPAYDFPELARLMGVTERRARSSASRLVGAGLMGWTETTITFPEQLLQDEDPVEDTIGRGRGRVAIPRRMLRLLAGGARPALIATTLGLLLRCLSRRRDGFDGRGRVKASWVAQVFEVDLRRVKAARLELVGLGWIQVEDSDQWALNRWGRAYRIDLGWDRAEGSRLPPPVAANGPALPPPESDQEPLRERIQHQEPGRSKPAGVEARGVREQDKPPSAPDLGDVRPEDLCDTGRTLRLFDQAVDRKLVGASENDRLRFLAVAEHARVVGTVNPGGLFARLVRRGWWHFATMDDEDVARRRLREHLHGRARPPEAAATRRSSFVPDLVADRPWPLGDMMARLRGLAGG